MRFLVPLAAALAGFTPWLAACAREPVGADVVVRIDSEDVRYSEFESYLRDNAGGAEPPLSSSVQSQLFDRFVDERLLARLAAARGFTAAATDRHRVPELLLRELAPRSWTELQLRAYYQAHQADYRRPEEVHLRQILVGDREVAEEARRVIAAGRDFADAAATYSKGPKAHLGGDQQRLAREDLPPAFADAIFDLAPGEVTDIVSAEYGFHLFEVVERFPAEMVPLAAVADDIRHILSRRWNDEQVQSFIDEARGRYNVAVFRPNFPFNYWGYYAQDTSIDTD